MRNYTPNRQAGMTLIELTVVLLILIGLAGLLVPYVADFTQKTHDSTGTNNLAALNGNIGRFEADKMRSPDNLESLVDVTAGTIYSKLMNPDLLQVVSANSTGMGAAMIRANSLNAAGMQTVLPVDDTTTDATFNATNGQALQDFTAGAVNLAALCGEDASVMAQGGCTANTAADIEAHLAAAFGGVSTDYDATCYDYVAFGIGDQSELIGSSMQSAPIHFAASGDMGPVNMYNRFIAVYKVDKDNATAGCSTSTDRAKFVGTAMLMMQGHLWGLGHSASHAYENIAAN